jgi:imidazolonepropionase-like amidohydrolase
MEQTCLAVEEAHRQGKPVAVHAYGGQGVDDCLEVGVDHIEHGIYMEPRQYDRIAELGRWLVGTLSVFLTEPGPAENPSWPEEVRQKFLRAREATASSVEKAKRAGVKLALGTDNSSCSDVQNMFQAMKLFALFAGEGGHQAFAAATMGGAAALGLGEEIGRLEPGRKADITLLSLRDPAFVPLNDAVRQLVYTEPGRSVRHVIVDGRVVLENGRAASVDEDALCAEVERVMPALRRELEAIRRRNERLLPYVAQAHARTAALELGLDRYRTH